MTVTGRRCERRAGPDGLCHSHAQAPSEEADINRDAVSSKAPFLQAEEINFSYGRLQVLFEASIDVARGEALALLGTNGAGKSTLLRVLCGLERPDYGRVTLDAKDITGRPAEDLTKHGVVLVSGGRSVFADLTVSENLEMQALTVRKRTAWLKERREVVLSTFPRLAERMNQQAGSMSGGEQQQLALAKALLLEPKLLCIDELSLGLAPVVVGELVEVVTSINATGVAVIVVEQSLNIAAHLCARAVFMEKGAVRFEGQVCDLLERDDLARAVFLGSGS